MTSFLVTSVGDVRIVDAPSRFDGVLMTSLLVKPVGGVLIADADQPNGRALR